MVKKVKKQINKINDVEKISFRATKWIGTPQSIFLHTLLFVGIFALEFVGLSIDKILLILTTAVSLEAIYLAIFIQMTVNRNTKSLEEVEADIDEIQEDVDELQEDVEGIEEEDKKDDLLDNQTQKTLNNIEERLQVLLKEIETLRQSKVK